MIFPENIDSTVTREECETLHELARGKTVLELGALNGRSTVCIAQSANLVVSVDWHQGDSHSGFHWSLSPYLKNLVNFGVLEKVIPVVGRFENVVPLLADDSYGLIFVDGHHAYDSVRHDIARALPKLTMPGTMVFHDYGVEMASTVDGQKFGVKQAVDERLSVTDTVGSLAVCELQPSLV